MSNKTILFADDSVTMRSIMEKTFFAEPFDVVTVPSGEAAIAKVKEIEPAVVIVDAGMVGISGYDVCKAVREIPHLSDTPLVILSGVSKQYDDSLGQSVGVDEHIKKPFDTTQIIEKITTLAARPRMAVSTAPSEPSGDVLDLVSEAEADTLTTLDAPLDLMDDGVIDEGGDAEVVIADDAGSDDDAVILTEEDELSIDEPVVEVGSPPKKTQTFPRPSQPMDLPRPRPIQVPPHRELKISADSDDNAIGEEQPIAVQEPEPVVEVAPEVEPIELEDAGDRADSGSFQVGTLAELAQMDHKGAPLKIENRPDAIEIPSASTRAEPVLGAPEVDEPGLDEPALDEPVLGASPASLSSAMGMATVQAKVDTAVSKVASGVGGVTAEQTRAIESLTRNVIEQVVWEVIPDLAETLIKEEIARLLKE